MKFYSFIILIFIFLTLYIFADDEPIPIVEYHICWGISDRNYLETDFTNFLTKTHNYLESKNTSIAFNTDSIFTCEFTISDTLATLRYYEETNSEGIIDISYVMVKLSNEKINKVSPILSNDISISISLYKDNAHELLATFLLYALGEIDIAEKNLLVFQEAIDDDGGGELQSIINYYLGNIALMNGDLDLAIERYDNKYWLCTIKCTFVRFTGTNLAWALIQINKQDEAIEIMTDGVEQGYRFYRNVTFRTDRAQLYALTFDYTSAITDMDFAIEYAEANDNTIETIASLYKQRGDIIMLIYEWNRALADYNTAIDLDPDYAEAYYRRGILLYTMVERENAVADFETYLKLDPNGQFANSASEYINNIQTELDALGG